MADSAPANGQPEVAHGGYQPPSNSAVSQTEADADKLATELSQSAQVTGEPDQQDEPDLSLRLKEGLTERPEAQITTQVAEGSIYSSANKFEDLPLSQELLQGLYVEMKFERPSRIQALTLPMILTPPYRDLIAQAHNGSGKTTCFVLSMLSRVNPALNQTQALCICPTRELVVQVGQHTVLYSDFGLQNLSVLNRIGKFSSIRATSTATMGEEDAGGGGGGGRGNPRMGGGRSRMAPITEQVVIGTHGKLKMWVTSRQLSLDSIQILVFDEADEMLRADNFADDSVRLIKNIRKRNPQVQLLLFSATFNEQVKRFAIQISPSANHVFVAKEELSLDVIAQYIVKCPDRNAKTHVLKEMIFPNCERLGQTIIFVRSREGARNLHKEMEAQGYKCTSIQGDMLGAERDKVVSEFRDGVTKILIATDVLARGFDVSQVTLVINYDVPVERDQRTPAYETYLHRIGRSGRFGRKGVAFNLVAGAEDRHVMSQISQYFNKKLEEVDWDDEDTFIKVLEKSL